MVKHKGSPGVIPDLLAAHFVEGIDGLQIKIVDLCKIHLGGDNLAGLYGRETCVAGKNLFNGMHGITPKSLELNIVYNIHVRSIAQSDPQCNRR